MLLLRGAGAMTGTSSSRSDAAAGCWMLMLLVAAGCWAVAPAAVLQSRCATLLRLWLAPGSCGLSSGAATGSRLRRPAELARQVAVLLALPADPRIKSSSPVQVQVWGSSSAPQASSSVIRGARRELLGALAAAPWPSAWQPSSLDAGGCWWCCRWCTTHSSSSVAAAGSSGSAPASAASSCCRPSAARLCCPCCTVIASSPSAARCSGPCASCTRRQAAVSGRDAAP